MRIDCIGGLLLFPFLIVLGCKRIKNDEFYNEIASANYDHFRGKSLFIRGVARGNSIVFLWDYSESYNPCASIIFTADQKNYKILDSKVLKYEDTCKLIITISDPLLVQSFLKLNLTRLMVKNNGNIYISTSSPDHFDMIKILADDDTAFNYKNWRKLDSHWFVKNEE